MTKEDLSNSTALVAVLRQRLEASDARRQKAIKEVEEAGQESEYLRGLIKIEERRANPHAAPEKPREVRTAVTVKPQLFGPEGAVSRLARLVGDNWSIRDKIEDLLRTSPLTKEGLKDRLEADGLSVPEGKSLPRAIHATLVALKTGGIVSQLEDGRWILTGK